MNSYIFADLKVTLTPAANPFLVLKLAIDFLNLVTIAFWPVIEDISSWQDLTFFASVASSPNPIFKTILITFI